ncbi:unnamed protein product, partial [Symbiodinium sp. KB8]
MSAEKAANPHNKRVQQHVLLKSRTVGYFCGKCKLYGQDPSSIRPLPCVEIVFNSDDEAESPQPKHADLRKKTKLLRDLQTETLYLEQLLAMRKKELMDERKRELARVKAAEMQENQKNVKPPKPSCLDNVETQLMASPGLSPPKPRKLDLPSPTRESEPITPTERESPMSDKTNLQLEEAGKKRPLPADSTGLASKRLKTNEPEVANLATPPPPGASVDLGAEEPGLPVEKMEKASGHNDAVAYMSPSEQTAAINAAKRAKAGHDDEDDEASDCEDGEEDDEDDAEASARPRAKAKAKTKAKAKAKAKAKGKAKAKAKAKAKVVAAPKAKGKAKPGAVDMEQPDDDEDAAKASACKGKTGKAKGGGKGKGAKAAKATEDPEPVGGKAETAAKESRGRKSKKTAEVEAQELPQTGKGARRVPKRGADEAAGPEADDAAKPHGKRVDWTTKIAQASTEEEKAAIEKRFAKSRKSTAYHQALTRGLKGGMTKEKALEYAKEAYKNTQLVVLTLVMLARHAIFIIEQPANSTYPPGFPKRILDLHEQHRNLPRTDLRCKARVDFRKTDRELFLSMRDDDHWLDASLHEVLFYLSESRDIDVPESWKACIDEYIVHVRQSASQKRLQELQQELAAVPGQPAEKQLEGGPGPHTAEAVGAHAAGNAVKNLGDVKTGVPPQLERAITFQSQDAQQPVPEPDSQTERTRQLPGKALVEGTSTPRRSARARSPPPPPPASSHPSSDEAEEVPNPPAKKAKKTDDPNYWKQMADRSFEWARARNLVRTNEVHGEEEASLVLEDSFAVAEQTGWE